MIHSIHREAIVETLLNSLEAERYVRGPLLLNVIDELGAAECFAPAADIARAMLASLEAGGVSDEEFGREVARLRETVRAIAFGGARLESPGEAMARAVGRPDRGTRRASAA